MIINKLAALRGLLQEIADDIDFSLLGTDIQDSIEDLTFNIPAQITLLKEKEDATSNSNDNSRRGSEQS